MNRSKVPNVIASWADLVLNHYFKATQLSDLLGSSLNLLISGLVE